MITPRIKPSSFFPEGAPDDLFLVRQRKAKLEGCVQTLAAGDDPGAEPLALGIVVWHRERQTAGEVTCMFRDSAFENDVAKANLAAILEQHGIAKVRSL